MEILLGLIVMGGCFVLMGAGLLLARKKNCLQGSCGGISSSGNPDISCATCDRDPEDCKAR